MKDAMAIIGTIITFCVLVIIIPFISFWLAYFGGWICSLVIGDTLANALNTLFNTTHFTKDILPMCAGALGWIGGYMRSKNYSTKKEKKA